MAFSFYWHDYETFGAQPSVDRPCQFAGIRTDEALNVLGKPLEVFCKPPVDYIPKPGASLVTGITPQIAWKKGLIEPDFIAKVHQQLSMPGTCGVGYNSIRFDDEVSRYTLYRNFYDPYAREWQNGCSRWDIIDMVRMVYALRPDDIVWPTGTNGEVSFKLELLTQANGLSHEAAHDAMSDVYATIDFAKLIKQSKPKLFEYALALRAKKAVLEVIKPSRPQPFLHVSSKYPASQGCTALVAPVGMHPSNNNAVLVVDLSQDPDEWSSLSVSEIQRRVFTKTVDLGDESRLALKAIHINKSPMVATIKLLDDKAASRLGIDVSLCLKHWQKIQALDKQVLLRLSEAMQPTAMPVADVDQQLYNGFFDGTDKAQMRRIHTMPASQLIADDFGFTDKRLAPLLFRYKARNWPEVLTQEEQEAWQHHCFTTLSEASDNNPYVIDNFFEEIEQLMSVEGQTPRNLAILEELQAYGDLLVSGELLQSACYFED